MFIPAYWAISMHVLCNIIERNPYYGTFGQIPPFLFILNMLLLRKRTSVRRKTMDIIDRILEICATNREVDELLMIFAVNLDRCFECDTDTAQ